MSSKGTGGMESSVVLIKPRIRLFACTHPSDSHSLDCTDWLAYKHQFTARVQTFLDCGSLLYTSISLHPVFQTCPDCGYLFAYTIGLQSCPSNTFGLWLCEGVLGSVYSLCTKHVLDDGSLLFQGFVSTLCSNTFWTVDPRLRTRICFQHCVSNMFGLWSRVWVQTSCAHASVSSLVQTRLTMLLVCLPSRPHLGDPGEVRLICCRKKKVARGVKSETVRHKRGCLCGKWASPT